MYIAKCDIGVFKEDICVNKDDFTAIEKKIGVVQNMIKAVKAYINSLDTTTAGGGICMAGMWARM